MRKFLPLFFQILFLPFISAQGQNFIFWRMKDATLDIIETFLGVVSPFFELVIGEYSTSEFFFAKVLLLFILIILCKYVLDKTPLGDQNGKFSLIIGIIVSILAIRFINENDLIRGILIPYGTLGIALTTILPFVIFFYFIHKTGVGTFGRKFFWFIFVIIMLVLWFSKSDQIGEIGNWIYALVLIAAILLLIFDKSIHSYLGLSDLRKYEIEKNKKRIWEAKKELDDLEEHFRMRRINYKDYKQEKEKLINYIKELSKE
ncbi:MAG: hypothetical protein QXD05_01750 [Candidatus Pacearchaeota archaeon]